MANPQKENGFTPIANEILEALSRRPIPGTELRITLYLLRSSYGWNRKDAALSFKRLADAAGLSRAHAVRAVKGLIAKNILVVTAQGHGPHPNVYRFNKDYDTWAVPSRTMPARRTANTEPFGPGQHSPRFPPVEPTPAHDSTRRVSSPRRNSGPSEDARRSVPLRAPGPAPETGSRRRAGPRTGAPGAPAGGHAPSFEYERKNKDILSPAGDPRAGNTFRGTDTVRTSAFGPMPDPDRLPWMSEE